MVKRKDRAVAWFFAIIFIVSSSALTIIVILTMIQDNNQKNAAKSAETTNQQEAKPVDPAKQLQGKPLAGFTPIASIPELQKIDTTPGTGKEVKAGDTVTVDYTGAVAATGIVFQSSLDSGQPAQLSLNQVIEGWKQGIPGMKEGGTRRLLIPAALAYAGTPPQGSNIPANADLVFDVTVKKVGQ